jgi:pSer/pThr/pTyr-binding forkhead associated (FHA) protein
MVRLVVVKGGRRSRVLELSGPQIILGRGQGTTVRIPSADVSRRHCRLRVKEGQVTVEDLGSVNGTFLNGDEVTGPWLVYPGDRLEVGPVTFRVEYDAVPEAQLVEEASSGSAPISLDDEAAREAEEVEEVEEVEGVEVLEVDEEFRLEEDEEQRS